LRWLSPASRTERQARNRNTLNALAEAIPVVWTQEAKGVLRFSKFSCKPVGDIQVQAQQVFLCHGTMRNTSTHRTEVGYIFVLADGHPVAKAAVDKAVAKEAVAPSFKA